MSRTTNKRVPFRPYQTMQPDGIEKRYVRLGVSQLMHPALKSLNHLSFRVYCFMLLESGGKMEFEFPKSKYQSWCSKDGFQKAVSELVEKGFIEIVSHNRNLRKPNIYRFSENWKQYTDSS